MGKKNTYKVLSFNKDFIDKHPNYEQLVALQPRQVAVILGWDDGDDFDSFEGLVCIKDKDNKGKPIYRKVIGTSCKDLDRDHVALSGRSIKQLGVEKEGEIIIKKTNWFCYLWNNSEAHVRGAFYAAIAFGVLSLILGICSIILTLYSNGCCC